MKVFLYFIGKPRGAEANRIAADFVERIAHYAPCEMREIRPDRFDPWERHPSARKILLDPEGREMDSRQFTSVIEKAEMEGRDLLFLVGGADGLPAEWRARADLLLSLSRMTVPHELARAMIAEQIYRAFTTLRGHPYPR
ncbi:MAG TPA: 23S rRNA (pseudouridine(1915)-N(3))-methyltransferase RlmH [Bryobacteraceae bacterium]|nr:23S rRNA (pseudouridine(1915)-N(3))-methyltransferase RlmH [Bryobacteraceae bacterium]